MMVNLNLIPGDLKARKQWVLWKLETRDGNETKVPYQKPINETDYKASVASPSTWGHFDELWTYYETLGGYSGIAFVISENDPYTGIDLDHCIDQEGNIEPRAQKVIDLLDSYTEISPSGTGIRIFVKGEKPGPRCRTGQFPDFEIYNQLRLLSLTGNHLSGTPTNIQKRQEELDELYTEIFPEKIIEIKATPGKSSMEDGTILGRILGSKQADEFEVLWDGDILDHPSTSEADLHFCDILAFWTGRDEGQMDRLFRSSRRYRPKWDEKRGRQTYGEMTISKAISDTVEVYTSTEAGDEGARLVSEEELAARKIDNGPKFELNLPGSHYLSRYIAYGRDVSDAYPDYWFGGGLFQLSNIADKKIYIKLRQGRVYPNLYIFMAGRSSLSRKSTVVDTSEALLYEHCPGMSVNAIPTEFSPEAFIEHLDASPHSPWVRDEAAGVLSTMKRDYMRGFKDSLMQLYDCRPIHRKLRTNQRKKGKTNFDVDDPYLNILWATTDSSLAANTEINDTLSGFMARFIYHFPRRPKERWLPLEEGEAMNSDLELVVRGQLTTMSNTVSEMERCQLKFSKEASQYWTQWQRQRATEIERRDDSNEMQIHSRLVPLVAKLGMLFELGSSDFDPTRPIRLDYIVEACRLVDEYYQPMAMAVYDMVGRDLERNIIDRIIAFLKRHGGVSTKREISRHVKIKAKELQEYLGTMAGDGTIEYCEIKNPRGESTIKVVLNVSTVYTVDKVDTVNTVTRNTDDEDKKRNTYSNTLSSECGESATNTDPELGDRNDPWDSSDSIDRLTVCPPPQPSEPNAATTTEKTDKPRIFGLSIPYYLDLGKGQPPTVDALMQDQNWPKDKAVMAIGILEQQGYSRGFNMPPD